MIACMVTDMLANFSKEAAKKVSPVCDVVKHDSSSALEQMDSGTYAVAAAWYVSNQLR
jgi:hypothetical protein